MGIDVDWVMSIGLEQGSWVEVKWIWVMRHGYRIKGIGLTGRNMSIGSRERKILLIIVNKCKS